MQTSKQLKIGKIYSRSKLQEKFAICDATLFTGIFKPSSHDSVWLFATEKKTPDRTPYHDRLVNDTLYWDGQTTGRKDNLIINHQAAGLELLLFYRKKKYEHPGAAFRYEGIFEYVSHKGRKPAHFILRRVR